MKQQSSIITIVIPNWNGRHLLETCFDSLLKQTWSDFEVILVDNGSKDDSVEYTKKHFPLVNIIRLFENKGFACAVNYGIRTSDAKYVVLLNNDTAARENWLDALIHTIESSPAEVACLASKMLQYHNPRIVDDAGDILTWHGGAFKRGHGHPAANYQQQDTVLFPCAGAALYRRNVLEKLGGFDESFFAYLEDIDLGLRIQLLGYTCLFVPRAEVLHVGHGSNIARQLYIFLSARNRMMLFLKNIPISLLIRNLPLLVYGWFFFWVAHNGSVFHLRGSVAVIKYLPHILKERRKISLLRKLNNKQIQHLLEREWPEVSLRTLFANMIRNNIK